MAAEAGMRLFVMALVLCPVVSVAGELASPSATTLESANPSATLTESAAPSATAASEPAPAAVPAPAAARGPSRWVPIVDADLRGAFSKVSSAKWTGGVVGSVFALPAYRLTDSTILLPIYSFDGAVYNQVIEEVVLFQHRQVHSGSLGVKQALGEKWDAKLSFDAAYALTKETRGETIGKGLYDYCDLGGRGSVTWNAEQFEHKASASLAVRAYSRKYPNFRSLASENEQFLLQENPALAASIAGKEKHPKDFTGVEPALSAAWWWTPGVQTRAGYALSARSYSDRFLRTTQGALSSTKRADQMHRLETETTVLGIGDFTLGAALAGMVNLSNMSVYDANQPVNAYIPHFYQFTSVSVEPWTMWVLPVDRELKPRVRLGASLLTRQFTDRLVQDAAGAYHDATQRDTEWGADLRGWYPIRKWIGATAGIGARIVRSNNKFQQFLRYNYEVLNLSAGVTLSY